jgi:uncharacterized protein (DUF488 family)
MLYTVGHGTRSLDDLVKVLKDAEINILVDVRSYPASRTNPQFNKSNMETHFSAQMGIEYMHVAELGGRRGVTEHAKKHTSLRVAAFRNYAAYMDTDELKHALSDLIFDSCRNRTRCASCAVRLCGGGVTDA